jgi:acyl carrier protein
VSTVRELLSFEEFGERLLAELELVVVSFGDDTRLVDDLGFDSVLTFELLLVVEEWIGVMLPEALIGQLQTLGDVYAVYGTRTSGA